MKNQILHIFKNDVRHFWREIVLMIAIVVAYGWHTSTRSQESGFFAMDIAFSFSSQILSLLVPVSFIFLIVRAAHAECPVGDRQFWVTRPYDWRQLLAAKLLFVASFVNLPLFVLQVFLLWRGGFWPPRYIWGLLLFQLVWILFIFLPVGMLAVVTASIGQFVLSVLGVLLYFIAFGTLIIKIPNIGVSGTDVIPERITLILVYAAILAVVLRQYARRRTAWSRIVLLGVGAAVPVLFAVTPYRTIIAHVYPVPGPEMPLPVKLAFDPAKPASLKGGYFEKNKVHIKLPLLVSGMAEGSKVTEGGIFVRIEAPGGPHWESGWTGGYGELLADRPRDSETVTLERDFFERVKSVPVNVHLTYALTPARAKQVVHIVAGPAPFTVPGDGQCLFSPLARNQAVCFFPPVKTERMLLSAKTEEITCKPGENAKPLPAGTIAYGWVWQVGSFGLNPVSAIALELSDFGDLDVRNFRGGVCPGTPLTIYAAWRDGPRYRADLEIDGIHLADYKLDDSPDYGGGFGVMVP
jgi:hypothetical protein